jgi:hypothetical protein
MEIMVKVCDDSADTSSEAPEGADMPDGTDAPEMTPEEAVARFRELVKGAPKDMTAMQVQEELKKVLAIITGEDPEED